MDRRALGDSGLQLSSVGLGGYELQGDAGWSGARDVVNAAVAAGINWIDTAEAYYETHNEEVIAAALRDTGTDLAISSKVAPRPDGSGFEPASVRSACEASLRRLGVDRLDIYLLHWPDDGGVPFEDTWTAMRRLVDDGLVRLVGLSNFDQRHIERAVEIGPVNLVQDCLSPLDRLENRELFRWCREQGIDVVTYEPLANGMLAGAIRAPEDFARVVGDGYAEWGFWKRLYSPGRFERSQAVADGMKTIAASIGCTLAQLALAWNVHQTGVTATLAGSRNPVHVRENAEAALIQLSAEQLAALEALVELGPTFA